MPSFLACEARARFVFLEHSMHHLEEEKFFFPYMYYFNIFTNALRNDDAILRTFQLPLVGNGVTSPDKNIVIACLKHIFISTYFAQHIQCILSTHNCNRIETKAEFYQFTQLPDQYLHGKNSTYM